MRAELVRDISRLLQFLCFILQLIRRRKNYYFGLPGAWTDSPVRRFRSEETLSWGISWLRHCDPRSMPWRTAMKLYISIGTRLGLLVLDFSACFGYFTKWDQNYFEISWDHFQFSLLFTRGINGGYYMAAQRHEISLRVVKNISRLSAPFEQSFVFVECHVVKLLSCVLWPLRFN